MLGMHHRVPVDVPDPHSGIARMNAVPSVRACYFTGRLDNRMVQGRMPSERFLGERVELWICRCDDRSHAAKVMEDLRTLGPYRNTCHCCFNPSRSDELSRWPSPFQGALCLDD
jgi:hypothetical protein